MEEEGSVDSEDEDEIQQITGERGETREIAELEKGRADLVSKRSPSKIKIRT